jgi:hypothetical protein
MDLYVPLHVQCAQIKLALRNLHFLPLSSLYTHKLVRLIVVLTTIGQIFNKPHPL